MIASEELHTISGASARLFTAMQWRGFIFWAAVGRAAEPTTLADLAKEYQTLGLPTPAKDARLMIVKTGERSILNDQIVPARFGIGFEHGVDPITKEPRVLWGIEVWPLRESLAAEVIEPKVEAIARANPRIDDPMMLALQCEIMGWHAMALHFYSMRPMDADKTPTQQLTQRAWNYWCDQSDTSR